jgi:hypothetical protein
VGIGVRHGGLRLKRRRQSAATPTGGLLRDQGTTPTVNNVPG